MTKTVKYLVSCLLLAALFSVSAWAEELMVGGQVIGIQARTNGVLVADIAPVEGGGSPAEEAGIKKGDFIVAIDGQQVQSAGELVQLVGEKQGEPVCLSIKRQDKELELTVKPVLSAENQWMLGMWLRDGISGVGTLTFYNPETGIYGALGHSISDVDTGLNLPLKDGDISYAEIIGISKGVSGAPGELKGCADVGKVLGNVEKNTIFGIYGHGTQPLGKMLMETAEVKTGPASILSTISGSEPGEYSVEISRVYKESDGTRLLLKVTDPELIAKTGGIVQGMSGSPIIQDGKLVGAVTHVFVNDPVRGYGISIQNMLEAAA